MKCKIIRKSFMKFYKHYPISAKTQNYFKHVQVTKKQYQTNVDICKSIIYW